MMPQRKPEPTSLPLSSTGTSDQDDPELARALDELAQLLFDIYLWRLEEERKTREAGRVDKHSLPTTM
jgi:hypothetical protein